MARELIERVKQDAREQVEAMAREAREYADTVRLADAGKAFWSRVSFFMAGIAASVAITLSVRPL